MVKSRRELLAAHDNDYSALLVRAPDRLTSVSVVVPWFNARRYHELFSSGLAAQTDRDFELVLVDDGSSDPMLFDPAAWQETAREVVFIRHVANYGGAVALNTGCLIASGDKVVMLDADLSVPPNLVSDLRQTLSCSDDLCAVGFRGTATVQADGTLPLSVLRDDWRAEVLPDDLFELVAAHPPAIQPSRRVYRLLEETRDWCDFGCGRVIGYWDLPVMVVGHTVGVDRALYLEVGGTPEWCVGWGIRDTALGAALIITGAKIVPQLSVVSTQAAHIPLAGSRERQLAELRGNYRRYQHWLEQADTLPVVRRRNIGGRDRGVLEIEVGK